jgi:hypothetical protein
MVLKFLYLVRSKALTVPSNEELNIAFPLGEKAVAVTKAMVKRYYIQKRVPGAVWSEKVTKQNPLDVFQTFTLPSSPPVAII